MAREKQGYSPRGSLHSMTGFGIGHAQASGVAVEVELKAANSRFLDLVFRLPRSLGAFEADIRDEISAVLERGRVEITVNRAPITTLPSEIRLNRTAYEAFSKIYRSLGKEMGASPAEVRAAIFAHVLSRSDVLSVQEPAADPQRERTVLLAACRKALSALQEMRQREGAHLVRDLRRRVKGLAALRKTIGALVARRPEAARDRIVSAVKRLGADLPLDPQRLHTEIALIVDRSDVTEELVRLDSHLVHFQRLLATPPAGKKLDFMVQELLREFNTIGSKAQESAVQAAVVEAKSELEKIREQVQNLE